MAQRPDALAYCTELGCRVVVGEEEICLEPLDGGTLEEIILGTFENVGAESSKAITGGHGRFGEMAKDFVSPRDVVHDGGTDAKKGGKSQLVNDILVDIESKLPMKLILINIAIDPCCVIDIGMAERLEHRLWWEMAKEMMAE